VQEETPTPRERRLVKNELDFAAYNERRREFEENEQGEVPFVCECGDTACFKVIDATPAEWEQAHSRGDQFVVAPTHVFPNVESIVEQSDRYWVVRKYALTADA
jgi:hypothetical protein